MGSIVRLFKNIGETSDGYAVDSFEVGRYLDLLRKAFETANVGITITDTKGVIIYTNPAEARMHGYEVEDLIGKRARILAPSEAWSPYGSDWLTASAEAQKKESVNIRKDGTVFPVQLTTAVVRDKDGGCIGAVTVSEDITERKRLESIAQAVNTMNNIGYVFSGIRHEIGNPINSIKTTISVLDDNIEHYPVGTIKEYLGRVMAELGRLEYILSVMKSFNMGESTEPKCEHIPSFMESFEGIVRKSFEKRGICWRTIMHPEVGAAYVDARALHQALLNILTNAGDACEGRDDPKIVISVFNHGNTVVIRVMDNGSGIKDCDREKIFDPFYTTKEKGTGLGLTIVRRMMAMMGCNISIDSRENTGTIVDITMPAVLDGVMP
jgi:PAS domain S-box-containing protein